MSEEIPRLLDGKLSPLERTLLESARGDVPSPEAMNLAASALGIAEAIPSAKWGLLAKGSAVALVSLVGFLGIARLRNPEPPTTRATEPVIVSTNKDELRLTAMPEKPQETRVVAPPKLVAPERIASSKASKPSIEGEIRMIEEARRALDTGNNGVALSIVTEYRKRFAHPALSEEATVIRILALDRSGSSTKASREASQFLATHPKSPHASRLAPLASRANP